MEELKEEHDAWMLLKIREALLFPKRSIDIAGLQQWKPERIRELLAATGWVEHLDALEEEARLATHPQPCPRYRGSMYVPLQAKLYLTKVEADTEALYGSGMATEDCAKKVGDEPSYGDITKSDETLKYDSAKEQIEREVIDIKKTGGEMGVAGTTGAEGHGCSGTNTQTMTSTELKAWLLERVSRR